MKIEKKYKDRLFAQLFHLIYKKYEGKKSNKTAFITALIEASETFTFIRDENAVKEIIKLWKRRKKHRFRTVRNIKREGQDNGRKRAK